jgi:purine-binding chemotaxis protein CheW
MTATVRHLPERFEALMLGVGDEVFAVDAAMVREILDPVPATRVPGASEHVPAIVNVRGRIIPLADIRQRFGMAVTAATVDTRIVVVEVELDGDPILVGVLADKVFEVADLATDTAQPVPRIGTRWRPDYVRCIARWRDDFVVVPDLARILH